MTKLVTIPEPLAKRIRERKPFTEKVGGSIVGYWTRGGTYVIASSGRFNDDDKPRDLLAIVPVFTDSSTGLGVVQLRITAAPEFVAEVERVLR